MINTTHTRQTGGGFLAGLRLFVRSLFSSTALGGSPPEWVVCFDVWNTTALIRAWPVEPLCDVGKSMNIMVDQDAELKQRFVDHCNELPISDPRAFAENLAHHFSGRVTDDSIEAIRKIIKIEHDAFAWYRDVAPVFRTLKDEGLGVGLISDTWHFTGSLLRENTGVSEESCDENMDGLRQLMPQVHPYIDHVILSCDPDVQCCKPHRKPFDVAANNRFRVKPERCIYVGDNVTKDMMGALNAGWLPILLDRTNSVPQETKEHLRALGIHCISSLFELIQLLRVLGVIRPRPTKAPAVELRSK